MSDAEATGTLSNRQFISVHSQGIHICTVKNGKRLVGKIAQFDTEVWKWVANESQTLAVILTEDMSTMTTQGSLAILRVLK